MQIADFRMQDDGALIAVEYISIKTFDNSESYLHMEYSRCNPANHNVKPWCWHDASLQQSQRGRWWESAFSLMRHMPRGVTDVTDPASTKKGHG